MSRDGSARDGHSSGNGTIGVFIAEDKDVIRAGLRQLVTGITGCAVIGDANPEVLPL